MAEFEELKRLPFIIDQLEAIQELHKRDGDGDGYCSHYECHDSYGDQLRFPCETRRLADEALNTK